MLYACCSFSGKSTLISKAAAKETASKEVERNYPAKGYQAGEVYEDAKPGSWGVPFWGPGGTHDFLAVFVDKKTGQVTIVPSTYK